MAIRPGFEGEKQSQSKPKETARIQNTEARRQKNRLRDCDTSLKKQSQFAGLCPETLSTKS